MKEKWNWHLKDIGIGMSDVGEQQQQNYQEVFQVFDIFWTIPATRMMRKNISWKFWTILTEVFLRHCLKRKIIICL